MVASWYFTADVSPWEEQEYTRAMTLWPIFYSPLTSDFGQIIKVKTFVQGRILSSISGSNLIFHMRMYETSRNIPHDLFQIIKVKIFVQGRISRPVSGSKLIFHRNTSRIIYEPWPNDILHGPLTSDFGQIIKVKIFVQGKILNSSNGSKLIFHMRMYFYEPTSVLTSWPIFHCLLTEDFGQFSMVKIFVIGRFLSSTDGSKLIFY